MVFRSKRFFTIAVILLIITTISTKHHVAFSHSIMTQPQASSNNACRLGGAPFGNGTCAGPCDLASLPYSEFNSVTNPSATYKRGQKVPIKYQRNNHGPGGFIRLTLVRPEDMMNKKKHDANAFYYTCWGANPVLASPDELGTDDYGFSLIGSDGEQHDHGEGYYVTDVTIPPCVPDGDFVLGWAWFGGTGSPITGTVQQKPSPYGYFSDYWSCAFIRIQGGAPLASSCQPVFKNDMRAYSKKGCMSSVDRLGPCTYEPCKRMGKYQKPRPFKRKVPPPLTPDNFNEVASYPRSVAINACKCLWKDGGCTDDLQSSSYGLCKSYTPLNMQSSPCINAGCNLCQSENAPNVCTRRKLRMLCR